jgi:hypothetical protein
MMSEIEVRIRELFAAIEATYEDDLTGIRPEAFADGGFSLEFSGGLSDAEIANLAHQAIYHVAHFKNPLKKWVKDNAQNPEKVERTIGASDDLALVDDLANIHKHGYPLGRYRSGKEPHLSKVTRGMKLASGGSGGTLEILPGPEGRLSVNAAGDSSARRPPRPNRRQGREATRAS